MSAERLWPNEVGLLAQLACLLEVSAPKPGNVSAGRPFRDVRYEHFLASAAAVGPALTQAAERPLGCTIRAAVEATARWSSSNTNLGMILLLAPLARAALLPGASLRGRVHQVLLSTTVDDAREAYAAIRTAAPGGVGRAEAQDLSEPPTVSLRAAMELAAERDDVAREYATDFATTFEIGTPALRTARGAGLDWIDATVETFLAILGVRPDTLIARKRGRAAAEEVALKAREVQALGGIRTLEGRAALERFDADLRDEQNSWNPGTTADLTAAALFVGLLETGRI